MKYKYRLIKYRCSFSSKHLVHIYPDPDSVLFLDPEIAHKNFPEECIFPCLNRWKLDHNNFEGHRVREERRVTLVGGTLFIGFMLALIVIPVVGAILS